MILWTLAFEQMFSKVCASEEPNLGTSKALSKPRSLISGRIWDAGRAEQADPQPAPGKAPRLGLSARN